MIDGGNHRRELTHRATNDDWPLTTLVIVVSVHGWTEDRTHDERKDEEDNSSCYQPADLIRSINACDSVEAPLVVECAGAVHN